jgi:hypothetical protein
MDEPEITNRGPEKHAREVLERSKQALRKAVEVVAGTPDADPLSVFPAPNERRADDAGLSLSEDQESTLRQAAAELGFGREQNLTPSEVGLQGAHVVIEGGQGHKIKAELLSVLGDGAAEPKSFVFAASPNRQIKGTEAEVTQRVLGLEDSSQVGATEYDIAKQIANQAPGFQAHEQETLPFSYDINNNFAAGTEQSGQLVRIGQIGEAPVLLLRVDRENYTDDEGQAKYRNQPGTTDIISIVDKTVSSKEEPIAFVTSGTYQPSREVDATRAALATNRIVGVATYGTAQLAEVKGESTPAPAPINQLPGEFHKLAQQVTKLEQVVQPEQS